MKIKAVLILNAILICNGKSNEFKKQPRDLDHEVATNFLKQKAVRTNFDIENVQRPSLDEEIPTAHAKENHQRLNSIDRKKRSFFDSSPYESNLIWTHSERLDENGDFILRWVTTDTSLSCRIEAKTKGYVGVGFNSVMGMKGADLLIGWVDDRNGHAQILDCDGPEHGGPAISDDTQNYELVSGFQNQTHTVIEFRRQLDTCDSQDFVIGEDTTQVLWAMGSDGSDGQLPQGEVNGARPLRLTQPVLKPDTIPLKYWDVTLRNLTIPNNKATLFWCKIFKTPDLKSMHHIIGYQPIINSRPIQNGRPVSSTNVPSPVHHIVLYECANDPYADKVVWNQWALGDGFFGPVRPREWASCLTPIAAWAKGSKGEFLPENVGIPLAEENGVAYYMLEVHYDNKALHEVLDNSGIRVHYTPSLRQHSAALLGAGIGISALHVVPPKQRRYRTVGVCSSTCSQHTLPPEGVTIVSVLLHAHSTARKIVLKHIRGDQELERISEENNYDSRYQQSRVVPGGRKFLQGDTLITECTYDSTGREKPILGGYSSAQEMCLSFILYYPRTELAGCYSMTPVKEFFESFGVQDFYQHSMLQVENMFLASGSYEAIPQLPEFEVQLHSVEDTAMQGDDQGVGLLKELIIQEPPEFRNKSFIAHLNEMPWSESLLTKKIEDRLYNGTHMTFCKKRDDSLAVPIEIQNFPKFTELISNEAAEKTCHYKMVQSPSATKSVAGGASELSPSLVFLVFSLSLSWSLILR